MYIDEKKAGEQQLSPYGKMLSRMADYIEEHGWCQHWYWEEQRVCIIGSMHKVAKGHVDDIAVVLNRYLRQKKYMDSDIGHNIASWNDTPGRTKEEVVAMLRKAAVEIDN